jgi:DNA-directed RNA polymerase subunit RPC12/RpoP
MVGFRCIACGREGEFIYDAERHECPRCGSSDVVSPSPSTTGLPRDRPLHRRPPGSFGIRE